jgi:uncharacterized protein
LYPEDFSMMNLISHIKTDQWSELLGTINVIAQETNPLQIVCYGIRTNHHFVWNAFVRSPEEVNTIEVDALLISDTAEKHDHREIREKVVRLNKPSLKFNVIVYSLDYVKEHIVKRGFFFDAALRKGMLLFGNDALVIIPDHPKGRNLGKVRRSWAKRFELAQNFLESGSIALSKGWTNQAIFMLHQSVEQCCIALINLYMDYRVHTHNLSTLLGMCEGLSIQIASAFPRITKSEIERFNILEKAYSETRYHDDYFVPRETVRSLMVDTKEFLLLANALFETKSEELTRNVRKEQVSGFQSIGIDCFARIVLRQGEQESVEVHSSFGAEHHIKIGIEESRLWITSLNLESDRLYDATVYITYTKLNGLVVHHAESISCENPINSDWLGIINNSSVEINLEVDVMMLDVTLNKHGRIVLSGSADQAKVRNNRSGDLDAKTLDCSCAHVTAKGSGCLWISVEEELHADVLGEGSLYVFGAPRVKHFLRKGIGNMTISNNGESKK